MVFSLDAGEGKITATKEAPQLIVLSFCGKDKYRSGKNKFVLGYGYGQLIYLYFWTQPISLPILIV